jgi:hypothetical protein
MVKWNDAMRAVCQWWEGGKFAGNLHGRLKKSGVTPHCRATRRGHAPRRTLPSRRITAANKHIRVSPSSTCIVDQHGSGAKHSEQSFIAPVRRWRMNRQFRFESSATCSSSISERVSIFFSGNANLRVGSASMQGYREEMEDAHATVLGMQGSNANTAFFGVFDGHGACAHAAHLLSNIFSHSNLANKSAKNQMISIVHSRF